MLRYRPVKKVLPYLLAGLFCLLVGIVAYATWQVPELRTWLERIGNGPVHANLTIGGGGADVPVTALLSQADEAIAAGDLPRAAQLLERALTADSDAFEGSDLPVMRKLFDTAVLLGDVEKAESVLGLLQFRGVSESTIEALEGMIALRLGERERAAKLFSSESHRGEHALGLLLLYILSHEHEQSQNVLTTLQQSPDPLLQHTAQVVQGAYDEFSLFEDGRDTHLDTLLARALAQIRQCPSAQALLEDVVVKEQDYRDAWIVLGYCRLMLSDSQGALTAFERAYALDPQKSEIQYFLGLTHEKLGAIDEAKHYLSYALRNGFTPQHSVRERLALLALRQSDIDLALEHYEALLEEREDDIDLYYSTITLLLEHKENLLRAKDLVEKAYSTFGDTAKTLDLRGWIALLEGDFNTAAMLLSAAVQQDSSFALAWEHKGMLAEAVQDHEGALEAYRKAYMLSLGLDDGLATRSAEHYNSLLRRAEVKR